MSDFEKTQTLGGLNGNAAIRKAVQHRSVGVSRDHVNSQDIVQKGDPQRQAESSGIAPAMGGVQSRPSKLGGAYYLTVNESDPEVAWSQIGSTMNTVSHADTTINEDENFTAYSLKYFQNTYSLARSMLCTVDGDDSLLLEINRLEGDGFGFADLFVKEFSDNVGDLCSKPVFIEDPDQARANNDHQDEEFLDLSADVGRDMIEHWLTSLRPDGGIKYDESRIYEALSSLGWNCEDEPNYQVLKEYVSDIVDPFFSIFLRQDSVDHIPSVYYGSKILKQFAVGGDLEANNTVVASICAIALRYCDPQGDRKTVHKIRTSEQSLTLLFETLEIIAPQISEDAERDEDMVDAMSSFIQKAKDMFSGDSMDTRVDQLAEALRVSVEEDL